MGKAEAHIDDQRDTRLGAAHLDASKMLEAALQQMDGIISGGRFEPVLEPSGAPGTPEIPVDTAVAQLVAALRHAPSLPTPPDSNTAAFLLQWLNLEGSGASDADERLKRLEADKQQLQLQVAVLMDQVEAQADKIADQEKLLADRKRQVASAEDLLQREVLSRSSLETHKLELLSVVCELKLQLAAINRDNQELRRLLPLASGSPRRMPHPQDIKSSYQRPSDHCASLPRQQTPGGGGVRKGVAFGKGNSPYSAAGDRSYSTPNLAETESVVIVDGTDGPDEYEEEDPMVSPKSKGIKKMLGVMTRSGSGNLEDLSVVEGEFRRGGVRATAGPRLGWTSTPQTTPAKMEPPRLAFVEWDSGTICAWLQEMGLECYVSDARRWVKSGAQLLAASAHEVDKELGIKNPLHRKKLQLALLSHQTNVTALDPDLKLASYLDTTWVLRWLDDTGLPQHKEAFLAARVDGRLLHRLTMDDLALLHVTSHLHVASLRRGIQVLRSLSFAPDCLERRSIPGEPARVLLWTNHRVMEWLRVVDLAEYAPNLRGSGVHGGLLFYEPRFTADLLASLLAIPAGKTLLRRHLNTHFKELLGKDCIQDKREAEATLGYIPLTPTTKLKVVKKSQFTLKRKKSRSELEFGDLVCPLDSSKTDDAEPSPKGRGCLSGN